MPLSGGDRKFYARELAKAERRHAELVSQVSVAYGAAHRLACEEWNVRMFLGGPPEPSPSIQAAIDAGRVELEVRYPACGHRERVFLPDLVWSRERPIHTLADVLFCRPCHANSKAKRRPELVALYEAAPPPATPAAARRAR